MAANMAAVAARAAHTATTLGDGRVFVAGGCVIDGCGEATDTTFLLLADGRTAVPGPRLAGPRDGHTATLVDAGVVLAGGFSGESRGALGSVELFDPGTDTVRSLDQLIQARGGHAAAALSNGTVLVIGGWIGSRTYTSTAEIIDPTSGAVTRAADAPVAADALDAIALADGRVLVTGGQVQPAVATAEAEIYDPARDEWITLPSMSTPRLKHLSILLSDGRALIIGGTSDDQHVLATTEVFDPQTNTFSEGPRLIEGRYKMTGGAVALPGNRVLIGGGGTSVELLDIEDGTSRMIASYGERGSFATVNAWGPDAFVVLGGYDDRIGLRRDYVIVTASSIEAP
jgi:hypothetical protein